MKLNDRLEKVQVGRFREIPFDTDRKLWFLLIYKNDWDACTITDERLEDELKRKDLKYVFVVWHGQWRTNLFLVDKLELLQEMREVSK